MGSYWTVANGGGLLTEAVRLAAFFLERRSRGDQRHTRAGDDSLPMVLPPRGWKATSASDYVPCGRPPRSIRAPCRVTSPLSIGSEIVGRRSQRLHRAVIVGRTNTFGKGPSGMTPLPWELGG